MATLTGPRAPGRPARRPATYGTSRVETVAPEDAGCPNCGHRRLRVTETWPLHGPMPRPAALGPEAPHVKITCPACRVLVEEFDA